MTEEQNPWRAIGCKTGHRVKGSPGTFGSPRGKATWRLRAPRTVREDWVIEAAHCPYLGKPPYAYGDDAWRIAILEPYDAGRMVERGFVVATSEAEALASVMWLDAVAQAEGKRR